MGFRFRRSFKILPGVRLNLNSKSTSVRIGPKGLGYTISSSGTRRVNASIRGTGASYSDVTSSGDRERPSSGNQKRGGVWPAIFLVIGVFVAIGLFNSGPDSSRSSGTSVSEPAAPMPVTSIPTNAPPTVAKPPAATTPTTQPTPASAPPELRYVTASSLNVRTAPNTTGDVIGKLQNGHQVSVLRRENGWLLVQPAPGTEGWISEQYTSTTPETTTTSQPAQALLSAPEPEVDRDAIIQKIIERSIQNYSGNCPCPYNTMRNGRRCGGGSAYSKPGGRSPICFPSDVTEAMIAAFRS
jgi:cell division protein FtsN